MIIFRYLSKQILQVMLAVTTILLIVGLTSRFIQYLGAAVAGDFSSDALFFLVINRLPDFLMVIMPLALFLGILLAYGRMYAENEMIILLSSGFSELQLLLSSLGSAAFAMVTVALLSLVLAPWGARNIEQIKLEQSQLTEIDLIVPGQFQYFDDGKRVTYVEQSSNRERGQRQLQNVFVVVSDVAAGAAAGPPRVLLADTAQAESEPVSGARFMRLQNVVQYEGEPGTAEFSIGQFDTQALLLPEPVTYEVDLEDKALRTSELIGSSAASHIAELQWRISMILLIPVIVLIAVPLSRVNPRQGQYSKLMSAALLYAVYFILLQFAREQVADGELAASFGLWGVHLFFIGFGVVIYRYPHIGEYLAIGSRK